MSPAHKKKSKQKKEEDEENVSGLSPIQKLEALAMLALTALGNGLGQGAIEALKHPTQMPPSISAPVSPNQQNEKWNFSVPQQKDQPTGDDPNSISSLSIRITRVGRRPITLWRRCNPSQMPPSAGQPSQLLFSQSLSQKVRPWLSMLNSILQHRSLR